MEKILCIFAQSNIEVAEGLSEEEMEKIERMYEIKFPRSLREFLMYKLPISKGFYNWRDFSYKNIKFIKSRIKYPVKYIYKMAYEIYWNDEWGSEPKGKRKFVKEVRKRIKSAPEIIPVYEHRYMPITGKDNPPIISIHGVDVIYYGRNLYDYLEREFGTVDMGDINNKGIDRVIFWSDIM